MPTRRPLRMAGITLSNIMALHTVISIRQKEPDWVEKAAGEFSKRLGANLIEIAIRPPARTLAKPVNTLRAMEAESIQKQLMLQPQEAWCIALDVRGEMMSTESLATTWLQWQQQGRLIWIIGGADGLDDSILQRASFRLSLSPMTFPHHLARVMLLEQIYRATTINLGHPYHRA